VSRPATPVPATGRHAASQVKDLDVDTRKDEPSFFGSFFSGAKGQQPKKKLAGASIMESPPNVIKPQAALSDKETMETEVIKLLIHSYYNIIKREMIDTIPKAISLTLVNHSKENLQQMLLTELYKAEVLDELLKESEYVVNRRREVKEMVATLDKAEEIVAGV